MPHCLKCAIAVLIFALLALSCAFAITISHPHRQGVAIPTEMVTKFKIVANETLIPFNTTHFSIYVLTKPLMNVWDIANVLEDAYSRVIAKYQLPPPCEGNRYIVYINLNGSPDYPLTFVWDWFYVFSYRNSSNYIYSYCIDYMVFSPFVTFSSDYFESYVVQAFLDMVALSHVRYTNILNEFLNGNLSWYDYALDNVLTYLTYRPSYTVFLYNDALHFIKYNKTYLYGPLQLSSAYWPYYATIMYYVVKKLGPSYLLNMLSRPSLESILMDERFLNALKDSYVSLMRGFVLNKSLVPKFRDIGTGSTYVKISPPDAHYYVFMGPAGRYTIKVQYFGPFKSYIYVEGRGYISNGDSVYLEPGTKIVVIFLPTSLDGWITNTTGVIKIVKAYTAGPVTGMRVVVKGISLLVGSVGDVDVYLVNASNVAGIRLTLCYNPYVINVVNVVPLYNFELFTKSVNMTCVKIAGISSQPISGRYVPIVRLVVKGISVGVSKIWGYATISTASGVPINVPVVPGVVRVVRSMCKIVLTPVSTISVGSIGKIGIYLVNCSSAAGIDLALTIVSNVTTLQPILKFIKFEKGQFVTIVNGFVQVSIHDNTIHIVIAGSRPCGMSRVLIGYVDVKALSSGTVTIVGNGTVSTYSGEVIPVLVTPLTLKISKVLMCDFNHNGRLDIGDVVLALRTLLGTYHSNVPCDLNHNGKLDIGDIVLLLRKLLGS